MATTLQTEFRTGDPQRNRDAAYAALAADGWRRDGYYWRKGVDTAIVDQDKPITVSIVHTVDGKWSWQS